MHWWTCQGCGARWERIDQKTADAQKTPKTAEHLQLGESSSSTTTAIRPRFRQPSPIPLSSTPRALNGNVIFSDEEMTQVDLPHRQPGAR